MNVSTEVAATLRILRRELVEEGQALIPFCLAARETLMLGHVMDEIVGLEQGNEAEVGRRAPSSMRLFSAVARTVRCAGEMC